MKTTFNEIAPCHQELVMEFDLLEAEKSYSKVLNKVAKEIKINGFPKGKIPREVLEKNVNKEYVQQEALKNLIDENLEAHLQDLNLYGSPAMKEMKFEDFNSFTATIEYKVYPVIEIGEYAGLTFDIPAMPMPAWNLANDLKRLRFEQGTLIEDFDAASADVQECDQIILDIEASFADGSPMDNPQMLNQTVLVLPDQFAPGIYEGILGMKVGDEKEIKITFPLNYFELHLAGKDAIYKVKLHNIIRKDLISEEKLKEELEKYNQTLEQFQETLTNNNQSFTTRQNEYLQYLYIIDSLCAKAKIDIPEWMIEDLTKERLKAENEHQHEHTEACNHDHEHDATCGHSDFTEEDKAKTKTAILLDQIRFTIRKNEKLAISEDLFRKTYMSMYQKMKNVYANFEPNEEFFDFIRTICMDPTIFGWLQEHNTINTVPYTGSIEQREKFTSLHEEYQYLIPNYS